VRLLAVAAKVYAAELDERMYHAVKARVQRL
jgi:hypothetical protein